MASLGVAYVSPWEREEGKESRYLHASWTTSVPTPIDGYQYAIHLGPFRLGDTLRIDAATTAWFVKARNALRAERAGQPALEIPLQPVIERAAAYRRTRGRRDEVPIGLLRAETSGPGGAALPYLTDAQRHPWRQRLGGHGDRRRAVPAAEVARAGSA